MDAPTARPAGDPALRALAALEDTLRQRIYGFIRSAGHPVTREQAAAAVGISRRLAAFHLTKLVEVGLLGVTDAPRGAVGKVGRRPKLYEPTDTDVRISIPVRQHDELAEILIEAVLTQAEGETGEQAVLRVAQARGEALGACARGQARLGRPGVERVLNLTEAALRHWGFEPFHAAAT